MHAYYSQNYAGIIHLILITSIFLLTFVYNTCTVTKVIRLSQITIESATSSTFTASFIKLDGVTFNRQGSTISISDSSSGVTSSSGNILAYHPNYQDAFQSNLATIFIHVQAVYPYVTKHRHISCKLFPNEDN